jgi:hypothetical protein
VSLPTSILGAPIPVDNAEARVEVNEFPLSSVMVSELVPTSFEKTGEAGTPSMPPKRSAAAAALAFVCLVNFL